MVLPADTMDDVGDAALAEWGFAQAMAWRKAGDHARADAWQSWANHPWARSLGKRGTARYENGKLVREVPA